ncbi:SDR family oxidoreductase [Streptomyces sp. NPDC050400]|uniref:SDR family oxidoreductase n=1 Tax=Streptomyces sp. NPDC050400 TaxID=3365610 RepID=UPI00378C64C2
MRVFVTGATGFVGSAVARELLGAGHRVVGLARSDRAAAVLTAAGLEPYRGSLDDPDGLAAAAKDSDGVLHLAFDHSFTDHAAAAVADLRVVESMGAALEGTDKPFVVTSALQLAPGRLGTEDDPMKSGASRSATEDATLALAGRGVRSVVLRLAASVHGRGDHGFVPRLIEIARERGAAAVIGDGANTWPAVHVSDAARLYRLALDAAPAGTRLHAVAEQGVPLRAVTEAVARGLDVPFVELTAEQAPAHFGWIAPFVALDVQASSARTRALLDWRPTGTTLLADLAEDHYFAA